MPIDSSDDPLGRELDQLDERDDRGEVTSGSEPSLRPDDVIAHIRKLHTGWRGRSRVDNDVWWERAERRIYEQPQWALVEQHPLTAIPGVRSLDVDPDRIRRLQEGHPGEPMPPVVLGADGALLDGWHRATIAYRRGDNHIPALVPANARGVRDRHA